MSKPSEIPAEDLVELRSQLASSSGPEFWRSLEELSGTPKFQHFLHREFPENATELTDPESRRHFLKLMGASLALAGVSGCAIRPPEQIAPWVKSPENIVPGRPQFYATSMVFGGLATGLIVESHAGRPTKIEGNPDHPASLGSTDIFAQAATLNLYDPDRSQAVLQIGQEGNYADLTYDDFLSAITKEMTRLRPNKGAGLRILTEAICSPSMAGQMKELLAAFPEAKWYRYEPVSKDSAKAGAKLALGEVLDPVYHFDKADIVVSLEADFLACGSPGRTADERHYAARREPKVGVMNRLYVAEAAYTNTGAAADHRLKVKPSEIANLALAIAAGVGVEGASASKLPENAAKWVNALAKDLKAHKGKALVLVGDAQPAYVHAVGIAINQALGSIGPEGTVTYIDPIEADPIDHLDSLVALAKEIEAGKVETLLIFGGNPAYTAPVDLGVDQTPEDSKLKGADGLTRFARLLKKVPLSIRLGLHFDETSSVCTWHVPEAHFLESWGDARAFDGTASVIQPLIAPLYNGKTAIDIVSVMMGQFDRSTLKVVQDYWKGLSGASGDFTAKWRKSIHDGKVADSAAKPKAVTVKPIASFGPKPSVAPGDLEILFRPDPTIWDGRFANNGWLQELPKPITKLTWDNAALIAPATATKLKLVVDNGKDNGRVVELTYKGRMMKVPVYIVPGQAEGTVVLHLGYGRSMAGRVGSGVGFNAYALRTSDAPWGGPGAKIKVTDATFPLASTQMHRYVEGRDLIRYATLADFIKDPEFVHKHEEVSEESLVPNVWPYESYKWGMAIDLNSCTGCNACVISCQAENNIPVIGKEQILAGRNMQWMEIDTYFHSTSQEHPLIDPEVFFQPRACMHCENAPCELVCPVAATVHDAEGLNVMVYNRCVGTRYCGNNCPYKVRHFNFLNYSEIAVPSMRTPSLQLLNNPDVTVRTRGVMEKCTYCIQRISGARINAKEKGEKIKDGDVVTACQAACPSQAIHFGDLSDKNSKVSKIKAESRDYEMLGELNTRPRTTYLGKIKNPNPELIEA
jgi:MoCo/4Fe-4S cofactor protein with predicted Tat translocation signal